MLLQFIKENANTFILDSGAFSAWTRGVSIDIDKYSEYALKNIQYIDYVVNLDVIPGEFGRKPTKEEIDNSAKKGWENYYYLIDKGIPKNKLMHVFHMGEEMSWLQKMVDNNDMQYIGLSPANDQHNKEKKKWLDYCMLYALSDSNKPLIKFHGFGVTSHELVIRYPWFSVDSAAWRLRAGFGTVFFPSFNDDDSEDHRKAPMNLIFTTDERRDSVTKNDCFVLRNLKCYNAIMKYLHSIGINDVYEIAKDNFVRSYLNIVYFQKLQEYVSSKEHIPTYRKEKTLFDL